MPRKGSVPKRDVLPDPVYHNKTVTKFINKVMLSACGKYIYYFTRDKIHEQAAIKRIHIRFRKIVFIYG